MKITEKILAGLIIILMMGRLLFTYPFSALLITLSSVLLSFLYFCFGFALLNNISFREILKKKSYQGMNVLRITATVLTGFVLALLTIYILFKFQRWPFGQYGLYLSLCLLAIVIIVISIKYFISKNKFYLNFLIRLFTFGIYGTVLFFVSNEKLLELKNKNYPGYIAAEKKLREDQKNRYLQESASEERQKMDLTKD